MWSKTGSLFSYIQTQNLMYWNGKCSLNIHGLCNGIVKQKDIFFSILCEPCWKVWGNCCVIGNTFWWTELEENGMYWQPVSTLTLERNKAIHAEQSPFGAQTLSFFSPLCISLFPLKCSCEINGKSNRWIIYREVILLVAEEVQRGICAEQNSGALFSKRKFQSNVFDLIMMSLWQWS